MIIFIIANLQRSHAPLAQLLVALDVELNLLNLSHPLHSLIVIAAVAGLPLLALQATKLPAHLHH